jgi:peptidyl-prolyl cis-trans isomerase SurA
MEFYKTNKHKYMWDERFKGVIAILSDAQLKEDMEDKLEQGVLVSELYDLPGIDENNLKIIEGAWAKGDNDIIDYYIWNGAEPDHWQSDKGFIRGELTEPEPKKLEEARGFHISDYQQYLEKNWLKELKKKYPVKVNKRSLKRIENV